jgi:hypothetical protein
MRAVPTRGRTTFVAVAALLILTGCTNLAAIRDFASASAESAQYTKLVRDYVETPTRIVRYVPADQQPSWRAIAAQRKDQEPRLLVFQAAIEDYMDAVGQLAADQVVAYDASVDALGKAVTNARFASAGEAEAMTGIAKVLVKAATDGWRRRQLRHLIGESDAPFQAVVAALGTIVERGFGESLENERAAINAHYRTLVRESSDKAGIAALQEWQERRLAEVGERQRAVEAYRAILAKIGEGHGALYKNRDHLSSKQVLADMHRYSKDVKKLFNAVRGLK